MPQCRDWAHSPAPDWREFPPEIHECGGRSKTGHKGTGLLGQEQEECVLWCPSVQCACPSNNKSSSKACYRRHELEKRRAYERRILEVEHGTCTPLVMSTSGGWGPSATVAFRRLAGLIAYKHNQSYSTTLHFMRCKISFALIDSASMCLRGPRSSLHAPTREVDFCDHPLDLIRREVQLGEWTSRQTDLLMND